MTRQEANFEILDKLYAFFKENPDQRFHQGLLNVGLLNRIVIPGKVGFCYTDETHTESTEALGEIKDNFGGNHD